jgi:undecaprenyl-diphosphatase
MSKLKFLRYWMPHQTTRIGRRSPLLSILPTAFCLFAFGFIAREVAGGKTSAFDRRVILALRDSADPSVPFGPAWLQEAARDVTSLGSIIVLAIITLAAVGYLFLARKHIAA